STTRPAGRSRRCGGGSTPISITGGPTAGPPCGRCTPWSRTPAWTSPRRARARELGERRRRSLYKINGSIYGLTGRCGAAVALVVQKYGGSSVADADGIKRVAQRIVTTRKGGDQVVVVVSAMGDSTDELMDL